MIKKALSTKERLFALAFAIGLVGSILMGIANNFGSAVADWWIAIYLAGYGGVVVGAIFLFAAIFLPNRELRKRV